MKQIIDFMRRLSDNNDREWFDAHRAEWTQVKSRISKYAEPLIEGIAAFDSSVGGLRPQDCTYRIARDTRFSPDKTPYKNWIGIYIAPKGKKSGFAGYYLHIAPTGDPLIGDFMLISGLYCPEPTVLRSVRDEILDNGAEFMKTVKAARGFTLGEENKLKRVPTGFPADSEYVELLKLKEFCLSKPLSEEFLLAERPIERIVEEFRCTQPFIGLLNRAVQYAYEEMM